MALIDVITRIFRPQDHPETTADVTLAAIEAAQDKANQRIAAIFQAENNRRHKIEFSREIYNEDTRAKRALTTLASDAVKGGYTLSVNDPRAEDAAAAVRERVHMDKNLADWARLTFRDGDSMLEVGVGADRAIYSVTRKPTLNMHRNSNAIDQFDDPERAFYFAPSLITGLSPTRSRGGRDVIWFAEWQIIHARWDHDEGSRYGRPLFAPAETAYKRTREGELDMAVRRKTRAGIKFVHNVERKEDIPAYKAANKQALANPLVGIQDFYVAGQGGITAVQGDANLEQMGDVTHHLKTYLFASPLPLDILGYGSDIDFSVIGHQKEQYDEYLPQVQEWVTDQIVVPILSRQWLLAGIYPANIDYKVSWSPKNQVTAETVLKIAQAAATMRALGVPAGTVAIIMAQFLPGIEPDMLMDGDGGEIAAERLMNIAQTLTKSMNLEG